MKIIQHVAMGTKIIKTLVVVLALFGVTKSKTLPVPISTILSYHHHDALSQCYFEFSENKRPAVGAAAAQSA